MGIAARGRRGALTVRSVAHAVRQYGQPSQSFITDALRETAALGWDPWVLSLVSPLENEPPAIPASDRIVSVRHPRGWRYRVKRDRAPVARGYGWSDALTRTGADLLHVHFGWTAATMRLPEIPIPVLVSFHGSDVTAWPHRSPHHAAAYVAMFERVPRATVVSKFIETRLRGLGYGGRLDLLPAGVRLDEFPFRAPRTPAQDARLLFVGRQSACKGLDVLLRALPAVIRAHPGTVLDVIGDGPDGAANLRLVKQLGLGRQVVFHGMQPRAVVARAMSAADVLVAPSRVSPSGEAEGSPVATKEALAVGLEVVGTRVGGLPETIPPRRRHALVAPDDAEALAAGVVRALDEPWAWGERAIEGRAWVEAEFDWAQLGRRLAGIYDEILAGVPPRRVPVAVSTS